MHNKRYKSVYGGKRHSLWRKKGFNKYFCMSYVSFIIAQILGLTATVVLCLSYTVKDKKKFLILGFFGDIVYGLTFIFVNSWGAGVITLLSCLQSLCFYLYDKKHKKMPKTIAFIFVVAFIVAGVCDFSSYWDLIPIFSYSWFTIALYFDDVEAIRLIYIVPNMLQIVYDLVVMAYANAIEDGLETAFLIAVTILAYVKSRKTIKKPAFKFATLKKFKRLMSRIIGVEDFDLQSATHKVKTSDNHETYTWNWNEVIMLCPIDRYG